MDRIHLLNRAQLQIEIGKRMPSGLPLAERRFRALLPTLPYVLLPGSRRRYFDIEIVWRHLMSQMIFPVVETFGPEHRRRPRRATA